MLSTSRIRHMMMRRVAAVSTPMACRGDILTLASASSSVSTVYSAPTAPSAQLMMELQRWTAFAASSSVTQRRWNATSAVGAADSAGDEHAPDSADMSVLIGVGWTRPADGADEHKVYSTEIGFFCARTKRTLSLPFPEAAKRPMPLLTDPAVIGFRKAVVEFCDPSFEHLEKDTAGVASSFQAVAVFLAAQNDATAAALQSILTVMPETRTLAGGALKVRAHYMSPVKDAWSMLYGFFVEQRRSIKQLPLPKSLFDAYTTVGVASDLPGSAVPEAQRWAIIAVKAPMAAAQRFAGPGAFSDSTAISLEGQVAAAVVARVIPRVRLFTINVTQKSVSVTEKFQIRVAIHYGAKNQSKNFDLTNVNDDKKLVEIVKFICRPSTLTVLLPTPSTNPSLVAALMRHMKPTNPTYVAKEDVLLSGLQAVPKSGTADETVKDYFNALCGRIAGGMSALLTTGTIFARDRYRMTSGSMSRVQGLVPIQDNPSIEALQSQAKLAHDSVVATPTTPPTSPSNVNAAAASSSLPPAAAPLSARRTTLNSPILGSGEMKFEKRITTKNLLDQWNHKIYGDPARAAREQAALDCVQRWLVMDFETTTRAEYKRRANPFIPHNRVVLPGYLDYKGNMTIPSKYLATRDEFKLPDLSDYQVIVGHNIKFDLHYCWRDPELVKFFERGGLIWDTMYGEYLLTGHYLKVGMGAGLEAVARSYGGTTPKLDAVKAAWAAGKDTSEIDHAVLAEYLEGDLRNTALVFEKQRARAFIQRQVMSVNARMDSLLCTTEMEYNGLRIDRDLAVKQERDLEVKCTNLKKEMDNMIPTAVPWYLRRQFNWSSYPTLSAMIFGGTIEFNMIEQRQSPRSQLPMYSALEDVSVPAQLAWLANCLGPKVVKTYTELYLRECGLRTNNVYSDAFDTKAIENKFDIYYYAMKSNLDDLWESHVTKGTPFPLAMSDEMKKAQISEFVICLPEKKVGLKYTVKTGAEPKTSQSKQHGFAITEVTGDQASLLATLRQFLLTHSGDGSQMLQRRAIALGRRTAEYNREILRYLGLTRDWMAESVPANSVPNHAGNGNGSATAEEVGEKADGEGGDSIVRPVAEPALSLGDDLVIVDHAQWYFPSALEKAQSAVDNFLVSGSGKKSSKKSSKKVVGAKKDAASANAVAEMEFLLACGGNLVTQSIACSILTDSIAENITVEYTEAKAASSADKLVSKRRGPPKRKMNNTTELDLRFEMKGLSAMVYLDRPFETASPTNDPVRYKQLLTLRHLGAIINGHDVFLTRLDEQPLSEVTVTGRLEEFVKDANERAELHRKFTSEETGKLQVGEPTLSMLQKKGDKLCETILELRGMEKLLSTYYDEKRTGMMALVHKYDNCIHHELQHNKTSTGRLASQNPNCQNIPKEDKSEIRDLFISRFTDPATKEVGYCVEADYSQLEVVTLCALSHDVNMTTDLKNKVDFHCKRVTMMHPHLTYEEVVQKAKKDKIPEFVKMRSQAKIFSFQRQYGAGVKMLSESTGLSHETIRKLIENEAKIYAGVDQFYDLVTLSCNAFDPSLQDGAKNKYGDTIFKGSFAVLTGSRYVFTESDVPKAMLDAMRNRSYNNNQSIKTTTFSPTHLKNYPVQGFAGEIVQIMLGKLWRHFVANKNYGGKALLTNTVHDCVWVDSRKEVVKEVARDVDAILSNARAVLNEMYPEMEVDVDFPVDVVAGTSMGHVKPLKQLQL